LKTGGPADVVGAEVRIIVGKDGVARRVLIKEE
jgi:hypothetical protein